LRAHSPFWIVDPFLVWTANDAIYQHDRPCPVSLDELADLTRDLKIVSRIGLLRKPASQRIHFRIFRRDDSDGNLRRASIIWTVEGHCGHGITLEPATRALLQGPKSLVEHVYPMIRPGEQG
jgi:hypothetical protein